MMPEQHEAIGDSLGENGVAVVLSAAESLRARAVDGGLGPVLLAVPISLAGASLTVTGMMVQKSAHQMARKEADESVQTSCVPSRRWLGGLALFGLGNLVTWVGLGLAPNGVLACFNSWNIVFSMVIAPLLVGERVARQAKMAAGVLVVGCTWVTCAGPRSYRLQTVDEINFLFAQFPFTISTSVVVTILLAMWVRSSLWNRRSAWTAVDSLQVTLAAAIFASYAVLFSKCTSMMINANVVSHSNHWGRWQFYLWACASLTCGLCQIFFLNESLRRGKASHVIPSYESMSMSMQIVVGGIFFREYSGFSALRHLAFWPGVLIVLAGVIALTRSIDVDAEEEYPLAKEQEQEPEQVQAEA